MLLTRRQPFYPSAAHDKFFSICTAFGGYTKFGIVPLPMIRDLYDNSIVAYKTGTQQTVNLVLDTIRFAMRKENHNHRPCRWFARPP